ncbi:hypothetical protein [Bifidobacterium sp. SO4]|uniref:hypothetical protein n=1 Tax=Bifidobacterium sp. SO4 TaxID=2809030 RepID=UPI001BDD8181|nr:hypothetical protein [Bifidobacterium sp. SO4]MBT1171722.1 hypothetical protein [Bifidobacterium sp. SO4]
MDELLKHLRRQCAQLRDDMESLGHDLAGFTDVDSESWELLAMKLTLTGWHKSKDSDRE